LASRSGDPTSTGNCGRRLEASDEATAGGETLAVFQCDECVTVWRFDESEFKAALTFAVDSTEAIVDSSTWDWLLGEWRRPSDN